MTCKTENKLPNDPFLQRAIEYWLDSANELGYQPLFCAWLSAKGYSVKFSIKNTNFEQGKDVVAVTPEGVPCGYQLKGGNISLKRWRNEVKPEMEALIDCAIQHPDIDKNTAHLSFLVTNGELDDSVRTEIVAVNENKWKGSPLKVMTKGDLLSSFQSMANGILPRDAKAYKQLMDLLFADGTGYPDLDAVDALLCQVLIHDMENESKESKRRDIAAALLYSAMIVGPYRSNENHASVARILILLISKIFLVVDRYSIDDKYWKQSFQIVWNDLLITAKRLEAEIFADGFEKINDVFGADFNKYRRHSASSVFFAFKLAQLLEDDPDWMSTFSAEVSNKFRATNALWGEASFVPLILLALLKKKHEGINAAAQLLEGIIASTIRFNGRTSKHPNGLLPPYQDLDFAVRSTYLLDDPYEYSSKESSYFLKTVVDLLVRMNQRHVLEKYWQEISFFSFEEFIPDEPAGYYMRHAEKGENRRTFPPKEQSWKCLHTEASDFNFDMLPSSLKQFPQYIPFFLVVFPFRVTPASIGFLDRCVSEIEMGGDLGSR